MEFTTLVQRSGNNLPKFEVRSLTFCFRDVRVTCFEVPECREDCAVLLSSSREYVEGICPRRYAQRSMPGDMSKGV